MIEEWINEIVIDKTFNYNTAEDDTRLKYYGDGSNDFEESSFDTTKECLEGYIRRCQEQIELAKKALEEMNGF